MDRFSATLMFGFAMSGLQDFLFDVDVDLDDRKQIGRNAAKRLRIRSAILTLVPALVAYEIPQTSPSTIHFLGGGKLLMTIPASSRNGLEIRLWELYAWLAQVTGSRLGAYWTFEDPGATPSNSLIGLKDKLKAAKWHTGRRDTHWVAAGQIHDQLLSGLGELEWEREKGGELGRNREITGFNVGTTGDWHIGPWSVGTSTDRKSDIPLDSIDGPDLAVSIPLYTPLDTDGSVAELYKLADEGPGASYLALLKLDGDGVGNQMQAALQRDSDLLEYRRLSSRLSDFFGPNLLNFLKTEFPRMYLVYSGGDDMVATGHFDDVLRAASAIRAEYMRLGFGTVSAGISFYQRQSSILKAVEAAERELEDAKGIKDAICIAGCRLSWDEYEHALCEAEALKDAVRSERLNRGALQFLRKLGEPWLEHEKLERRDSQTASSERKRELASLRFNSIRQMNYQRSRREREWNHDNLGSTLSDLISDLCSGEPYSKPAWQRLSLVATLAGWRTKKTEQESNQGA